MRDYFKNILPRLKNRSKQLDHEEVFVEKPWISIEEGSSEWLEYEFFRDGRLLVSKGGEVTWGKWELTPSSQRLVMEYKSRILLIQAEFVDDTLMVVKKSGSSEPSMVFVNQLKLPDLGFKIYLEKLALLSLDPQKHQSLSELEIEPSEELEGEEMEIDESLGDEPHFLDLNYQRPTQVYRPDSWEHSELAPLFFVLFVVGLITLWWFLR